MAMVRILHQFRSNKEGLYHYCAVTNTKQITLKQCEVLGVCIKNCKAKSKCARREKRKEQKLQQEVSYFTYLRWNSGKARSLLGKKVLSPILRSLRSFGLNPTKQIQNFLHLSKFNIQILYKRAFKAVLSNMSFLLPLWWYIKCL